MFTGQLTWTGPSDAAGLGVAPNDLANSDGNEAMFALVYATALGLSDEQCSGTGISDSWLSSEAGTEGAQSVASGPSGLPFALNHGPIKSRAQAWSDEPSPSSAIQATGVDTRLQQDKILGQPTGSEGNFAQPSNCAGVLNKSVLSSWMDAHALSRSSHHCAMYCRLGMEAAGLNTGDRPQSGDAADYGPFLLRHGAQTVPKESYAPQVGDVVVFEKTGQHPNGHIETYDGQKWVSDFMQRSFSPYRDASSTPPFTIYRLA
jgi:hypothetical protein